MSPGRFEAEPWASSLTRDDHAPSLLWPGRKPRCRGTRRAGTAPSSPCPAPRSSPGRGRAGSSLQPSGKVPRLEGSESLGVVKETAKPALISHCLLAFVTGSALTPKCKLHASSPQHRALPSQPSTNPCRAARKPQALVVFWPCCGWEQAFPWFPPSLGKQRLKEVQQWHKQVTWCRACGARGCLSAFS